MPLNKETKPNQNIHQKILEHISLLYIYIYILKLNAKSILNCKVFTVLYAQQFKVTLQYFQL